MGMYAGDVNGDGQITGSDFNIFNPKFASANRDMRFQIGI